MEQILFQTQSTLIVILMTIGVILRRKRLAHVRIMGTTIAWDLILILQIELSRGAIAKAAGAMRNPMILNIHVSFAVLTVLLYGFMIYTGRKIYKGETTDRSLHKKLGITTYTLRILTYITSYFVA